MRRLLKDPPKEVRHELIGTLTRSTLSPTKSVQPFDSVPYEPHPCVVCGLDARSSEDRMASILVLEFEGGINHDWPVWVHEPCFDSCAETGEPDVPFD